MVLPKRILVLASLFCALLPLTSCASGPLADALERSVAADPRLSDTPQLFGGSASPSPTATPSANAQAPADLPEEIPRYPGAQLLTVDASSEVATTAPTTSTAPVVTRWSTTDSADQVRQFYLSIFQSNGWTIKQPGADSGTSQDIEAERDGLQVTVSIAPSLASPIASSSPSANVPPTTSPAAATEFTLSYVRVGGAIAQQPSPQSSGSTTSSAPQPGDPSFIGPVQPSRSASSPSPVSSSTSSAPTGQTFSDISQAPEEVRQYIQDLAKLGVFNASSANSNSGQFRSNAQITRREYARWLVAANNAIYANRPTQKIRLGDSTDQPAFQDVPRNDPDFAAIQGLAEAGIIPSPLSGDPTAVTFRPNAPLTRESLILWKAPMDVRQTLPNATVQAIQQNWGFQDANKISPKSLRAVLADYQNGDLSNIRRAFGYTTLFQPQKAVTRAEAAATLWFFGSQGDGLSAQDALQAKQQS